MTGQSRLRRQCARPGAGHRAATPRIEADRELPADLVDALHEARLGACCCRELTADEVSPVDYVQAIEEIAKAMPRRLCIGQTSVCGTIPGT